MNIFEKETVELKTLSLKELSELKLERPDIQRNWQWKTNNQNNLIISILKDSPIGQFLVWQETSTDIMYITDGRHRYTVITEFMNNKFPCTVQTDSGTIDLYFGSDVPDEVQAITSKLGGTKKTWKFISSSERKAFSDKKVSVNFVFTDDSEKVSDMFTAINTASSNLGKVDLLVCKHHNNVYMKRIDKLLSIEFEKGDALGSYVSEFYRAIGLCVPKGNSIEKHLLKLKNNPKVQKREFFEMFFMVQVFANLCRKSLDGELNSYRIGKMNNLIEAEIDECKDLREVDADYDFRIFADAVREMNMVSPVQEVQKFQFSIDGMKKTFNKRLFCILLGFSYANGSRLPMHFKDAWGVVYGALSEASVDMPSNSTDSASNIVAGIELVAPYFNSAYNGISLSASVGKS